VWQLNWVGDHNNATAFVFQIGKPLIPVSPVCQRCHSILNKGLQLLQAAMSLLHCESISRYGLHMYFRITMSIPSRVAIANLVILE